MNSRARDIRETLFILTLTIGLVKLASLLGAIPWIRPNVLVLAALAQIGVPLLVISRRRESIQFIEADGRIMLRSILLFLMVSLLIFPVFVLSAHFYETGLFHKHYFAVPLRQPFLFVATQVVLVALPEEFLFRGWLQERLNRIFPRRWRCFGAPFGLALPLVALLFAFAHSLIHLQWWHFSIFFPALVFGWLREKSGGLVAPILFHAVSNVVIRLIDLRYL